jgi:hypothetical protein
VEIEMKRGIKHTVVCLNICFLFISFIPNCFSWNLSEKKHSCLKWERLSVTIDKVCTEYFNGLLKEVKKKEVKEKEK